MRGVVKDLDGSDVLRFKAYVEDDRIFIFLEE